MVNYLNYIEIDSGVRFGRPVIKGTRISVYDVLGWLASGKSAKQITEDFPELTEEAINACLAYAADREQRSRIA